MALDGGAALAVDADGDGWHWGDGLGLDCDDATVLVSPVLSEDGLDDVDTDCDGSTTVRRVYVTGMGMTVGQDFLLLKGFPGPTKLVLSPGGTIATASFRHTLDWENGRFHAVVDLDQASGGGCSLDVGVAGGSSWSTALSVGHNDVEVYGVLPGDTVDELVIACLGTGTASVNWLTVQDGSYVLPPLLDVSSTAATMGLPGGGREAVVAVSCASDGTLYAGSDVGGFAWSTDGFTWTTANGAFDELSNPGGLGAWGIASPGESEVFILTGDFRDGNGGGLHRSTDLGATWNLLSETVGGGSHHDESGVGGKAVGSGKTLLRDPGTDILYIASQSTLDATGASLGDKNRGVWALDSNDQVCRPYADSTLPVGLSGTTVTDYDALPSALAINEISAGEDRLIVGYRALTGGTDLSNGGAALYLCPTVPSNFDCSTDAQTYSCVAVDDATDPDAPAMDVRDVEADPSVYGRFWVVDGGRRSDSAGTYTLAYERSQESTVWVLDVDAFEATALEDTDAAGSSGDPSWNLDSGGGGPHAYRHVDACNQGPATSYGDLVPPRDSGATTELTTAVIDPSGNWILSFYSLNQDGTSYGCSRTFRADASAITSGGALAWEPLKEHVFGNYSSDGGQRSAVVSGSGSWIDQQVLEEVWAPGAVHDAVFDGDAVNGYDLLVASSHLWWIPQEDPVLTEPGWDTDPATTSYDMDEVPFVYAYGGGEAHQVTVTRDIGVCHDCDDAVPGAEQDVVFAGLWDIAQAELDGDTNNRSPATRDCHFEPLQVGKTSVDVWQDPETGDWQGWYVLRNQGDDDDAATHRMLLLQDGATGSWCWDGVSAGTRAGFFAGDDLMCADKDAANVWGACTAGAGSGPFQLGVQGAGHPWQIRSLGDSLAVMVADDGTLTGGLGGHGLWLISGDATTGLTYTKIPNYTDDGTGSCTEAEYFSSLAAVAVHPDSDPDDTGEIRLFTVGRAPSGSDACGLREVVFTLGSESSATWTYLDIDDGLPGGCVMAPSLLRGVEISANGEQVLTFGGSSVGSSAGGVCATDISDPASYDNDQAVDPTALPLEIYALQAHPHVEGAYFFGGVADKHCTSCADEAVYLLQHRYRPTSGTWIWGSRRVSEDDLENPRVTSLDWGHGDDATGSPMSRLYVGTDGSAIWEMALEW